MKRRDFLKGIGFSAAAIAVIPVTVVRQADELETQPIISQPDKVGFKDYIPVREIDQSFRQRFGSAKVCLYDAAQNPPQLVAVGDVFDLSASRPVVEYVTHEYPVMFPDVPNDMPIHVPGRWQTRLECPNLTWGTDPGVYFEEGREVQFVIEKENVVVTGVTWISELYAELHKPGGGCVLTPCKNINIVAHDK